jgi:GMP synthase-like glutamine amidotransferase
VKKVLAIRHVEIEGLGSFEPLLRKLSFEVEYVDTPKGMTPSLPVKEYALVFVLGGYMGVYEVEKYPFLKVGFQVIEDALKAGVPFIGVCLGAQMLAHVLGAKVYPGEKGKELGWLPVFKTGEHPFFKDWDKELTVFQLHGDTFDLPEGAVRVYSSEKYPNQAFVYENAIGLQFHVEVDKDLALEWGRFYEEDLRKEGVKPESFGRVSEEELKKLERSREALIESLVKN